MSSSRLLILLASRNLFVIFDTSFSFAQHISAVSNSCCHNIQDLRCIRDAIDQTTVCNSALLFLFIECIYICIVPVRWTCQCQIAFNMSYLFLFYLLLALIAEIVLMCHLATNKQANKQASTIPTSLIHSTCDYYNSLLIICLPFELIVFNLSPTLLLVLSSKLFNFITLLCLDLMERF